MGATPQYELETSKSHLAALRDSVTDFVVRGTDLKRVRSLRGALPGCERQVWAALAEMGWLGILIPESHGGLGLAVPEAATVAEALAPAVLPEPYTAACVLAAGAIVYGDNAAVQKRLLPAIAAGEILPALAWQEAFDSIDAETVATSARESNGRVALTGTKRFVAGAAAADGFIVSARRTDGVALYWVARNAPGVELSFEPLVDGTFGATLKLADVKVGTDDRIASPAASLAALSRAIDEATVVASAELLGLTARTLDMTIEYLRTRQQFGKPIGSFQALQHRAVDCYVQKELASAVLQRAIDACIAGEPVARAAAASRAKARCGEAALKVTREAIQMHGAIGFTDECDVGLYAKRAMALSSWLGNARQHRRRFAGLTPIIAADRPQRATIVPEKLKDLPADTDWNTLADDDFRILLRGFIEEYYPEQLRYMPRRVSWQEVREWNLKLAERGWIAPAWPREWGGMQLSAGKQLIYWQELERWGVERAPDQGVRQLGQVLMRYGTEEQKHTYLPKILACEHIWCQGYSEPNAGSDLASLMTSAVRDGDGFLINGQKIWTSMAHHSTHIYMLCRTDPAAAKKQEGISFFVLDLKTPGVTVRPIRNIAGHEEFCEVFFDNVRVSQDSLVGELNRGWSVAKAVLNLERLDNGSPRRPMIAFNRLAVIAAKLRLFEDDAFVETFTQLRLDLEDHATLYERFADVVKAGGTLGAEASILKIWGLEAFQRVTEFALEAAGAHGARGVVEVGGERIDLLAPFYLARLVTIGGGSNEIQRNIVSKYVLRLPN